VKRSREHDEAWAKLPGGPQWGMYVVPLLFPAAFLLAFALGQVYPGLGDAGMVAITIGGPLAAVTLYAVIDGRRKRRKAGLVPPSGGYSTSLEFLAAKLRERADELDTALRFGRSVAPARELASFAEEVGRSALQLDKRDLMGGLSVGHSEEAYLGGPMPEHTPAAIGQHARRLRGAADEIEGYAGELRARGGLYRTSTGERLGCGAVLLAILAAGAWLLAAALRSGGSPWLGAGLIVFAVLAAWLLVASQREPA